MHPLDPIRTKKQNGNAPAVRFRPAPIRKQPRPPLPGEHRTRAMWIAVGAVMAIVVIVWLSLLSAGILTPKGSSKANPLSSILESLQRAVASGAFQPKSGIGAAAANDVRLQELRSEVFPQFGESQ